VILLKIGIIGAGNIGGALTRLFTKVGHEVEVANSRGPKSLEALAKATGAKAQDIDAVVKDKDVIVVTIPLKNVPQIAAVVSLNAPTQAIIIDTCNYYPKQRDGRIGPIEEGLPESRWVELQLGRPVIKVFNTIYAAHLLEHGRPTGDAGRIALPLAGDDGAQKAKVVQLLDQIGFDAVDVGGIDESWRQQPGTPAYGADLDQAHLSLALAEASPARGSDWMA